MIPVRRTADISPCGHYRYSLTREWDNTLPHMTWIMLNPSTADADVDDPTIRRCISFARRESCGAIEVVNLFSWRATDPKNLGYAIAAGCDVFGPGHEGAILTALEGVTGPLVAGWGASALAGAGVRRLPVGYPYMCLGTTSDGSPRHPLYVRGDTPLMPWVLR